MNICDHFLSSLSVENRTIVCGLDSPAKIQSFLDSVPYRPEDENYCPVSIFRDGKAHCFDGGLFAAACLRLLGHPPVIVQMIPWNDDDHILAIYKRGKCFGALAKSNFVGLRYREPVYLSLRELIMSYFDVFYNMDYDFSLRGYSVPLRLTQFDHLDWMGRDEGAQMIARRLPTLRQKPILAPEMIQQLGKADPITFKAGMLITDMKGVYKHGEE
jgi:hypothetical protein